MHPPKKPAGAPGKLHASGDRNDDAYASDGPTGSGGAPRYDKDFSESHGGDVADAPTPGLDAGKDKSRASHAGTAKKHGRSNEASTKRVPPLEAPSDTAAEPPAHAGASRGEQGSLK